MNEERFTGKADIYKKFRPSYPPELIDYLYSEVGFRADSTIADIGAGTGIFSRLLLERGSHVICVEPNDDMRRNAENDLSLFENFTAVKAPAENTGLQEGSVDFVVVAQAFHWFDTALFKTECRRILKSGGKVAVVWNTRDFEPEFMKRDYEIRLKYCVDTKGMSKPGLRENSLTGGKVRAFFTENTFEERIFRNDWLLTREAYIGRSLSSSYSPSEDNNPEKYHGFVKALNRLFDEFGVNGTINSSQYTESYTGTV